MKKIISFTVLLGMLYNLLALDENMLKIYNEATSKYKGTIEFSNVNPFKYAVDSLMEDKFTNFSDTVFLIPKEIELGNNVKTIGYYFILNEKINLSSTNFFGDVKMPSKENFLFMSLEQMSIKDNNISKKVVGMKEYLVSSAHKNGLNIYDLQGIELGRYVFLKVLVAQYNPSHNYNICNKGDIEITKLLNNKKYIFKTCKSYGKEVTKS
jgi:hypothetical protein